MDKALDIRPAEVGTLGTLAHSLSRLPLMMRYGNNASKLEANLRTAMTHGDCLLVAHANDGSPVGLAWLLTTGTFGALGGYLKLIAVAPEAQVKGVGTALLAHFEREVFAASPNAFLLVSDFNIEAQRFYERHGYTRVGALPRLVLSDVDEFHLLETQDVLGNDGVGETYPQAVIVVGRSNFRQLLLRWDAYHRELPW